MSALSLKPVDETVSIEPTFEAILTLVAKEYGLPTGAIRAAANETAAGARDLFVWLADLLKSEPLLGAASYVAMHHTDALSAVHSVERQRRADEAVRIKTDEMALCLQIEAATVEHMGRRKADEPDALSIARRAMMSDRAASRVSIRDIQIMAAAVVASSAAAIELDGARRQIARLEATVAETQAAASKTRARLSAKIAELEAEASLSGVMQQGALVEALRDWARWQADLDRCLNTSAERPARLRAERSSEALMHLLKSTLNLEKAKS